MNAKKTEKYMKFKIILAYLFIGLYSQAQKSEDLIPKDAVTVFSINNFSLLQKISLDEMVRYDFMAELQQELFDGSTAGKTLKDSGIDFDQKLNVFYGKNEQNEISGFTFGVTDKKKLFEVFDDFEVSESQYPGIEFYTSYFNTLIIKGNAAILIRVEPTAEKIDIMCDSIWYARGNENPWYEDGYYESLQYDENGEIIVNEEFYEELEEEGEKIDSVDLISDEANDLLEKNYFELRDSCQLVLQRELLSVLCIDLFKNKNNLLAYDVHFKDQMSHTSDGIFYLDNSRNVQKSKGLWYFQTMLPSLYEDIKQIYTGNVLLGDLILNQSSIDFKLRANYGPALGSIYQKMNDSKFDKNVLNYIPQSNTAFFTYNVNLREAYEQAYKIIMPILSDEKNARISMNVLTIELLNEFVNKDALFGTYKGSMFGSFNGIQKVKTKKIEFVYDENTFDYYEKEIEAEEDMPIFTVGFSTSRGDIPEKVLKHMSRITSRFKNMGSYWVYENAILDAAPLYMINTGSLFIFTNDEDLAKNHSKGYGKSSIASTKGKAALKSGFMYFNMDWSKAIDKLPRDLFNDRQNEVIDALRGKTGTMELTSSKTSLNHTDFKLTYNFNGAFQNSGTYLLDLINSIYVISK